MTLLNPKRPDAKPRRRGVFLRLFNLEHQYQCRQLPRPKGRCLFVRPMGLTKFRASVPGRGVRGR